MAAVGGGGGVGRTAHLAGVIGSELRPARWSTWGVVIRIFVPTALVDYVHLMTTFVFSCTDPAAAQSRLLPCGSFVFS